MLSNFQKKIDNFSQKQFLKNNNETNKQEQNISFNPKKNLCMERRSKQTVTKNRIFHKIR